MKNTTVPLIASILLFSGSFYFGIPYLLPQKTMKTEVRPASVERDRVLARGQFSAQLLEKYSGKEIITTGKLSIPNDVQLPAIFPPDLIFRTPPKVSDAESERIAQAQRIVLLEHRIRGLEEKLATINQKEEWTWKWGWEKLIALVIWFFGTIATTGLKTKTEELMEKWWPPEKKAQSTSP